MSIKLVALDMEGALYNEVNIKPSSNFLGDVGTIYGVDSDGYLADVF